MATFNSIEFKEFRTYKEVVIFMIQFLRGTASQLNSSQTIFSDGQPIFEKDSGQLKIGNGVDIFKNLPYVGESSGGVPSYEFNVGSARNGYIDLSDHVRLSFGEATIQHDKTPSEFSVWDTSMHRLGYYNSFSVQLKVSDIVGCKSYVLCGFGCIGSSKAGELNWFNNMHTWSYSKEPEGYFICTVIGDVDRIPDTTNVYYNVFSTDLAPTST